jgi:broad specificity phosphatase PhoE
MRHAEPDWSAVAEGPWRGAAHDLAPLTATGEAQALEVAQQLADEPPDLVLSSPMTRALQTAALVATRLGTSLAVELDLREWLPDESYQWTEARQVVEAYDEMLAFDGKPRPSGATWESLQSVRERALRVLTPFLSDERRVLVVCHEVLIHALTGEVRTPLTGLRPLHP